MLMLIRIHGSHDQSVVELNILFLFLYRMRGSASPVFDTAKERPVAEREDHACVKGLAWGCKDHQ